MVSRAIIETPVIFFLGAGASKPFDKMLMGEFVEQFRTKRQPNELVDTICSKQLDLEFLIEQLQDLAFKEYLGQKRALNAVDSVTPRTETGMQIWPQMAQLASQAQIILNSLKQEVYFHYRGISNEAQT